MTTLCLRLPFLSSATLLSLTGLLTATPLITDFTLTDTQVVLVVEGLAANQQAIIQIDDDLEVPSFGTLLPGSVTVVNGDGSVTITAPRPEDPRLFFRAIAANLGTDTDLDGDGLPNAFETAPNNGNGSGSGTDPNLFDTDGDGFSDGLEFSVGTDANSAASFPELIDLPTVAFEVALSQAVEGDGTHLVEIRSEQSYSGPIFFSVNNRSTAQSPDDFSVPSGSSVMMSNGVAQLPVLITDDLAINPSQLLVLELSKNPPGNFYRAAGAVAHVVCLSENDCYWDGVAIDNASSRNFRMRLLRDASTTQWSFVAGNEDGLTAVAANGENLVGTSQSTGLIPAVKFKFDEGGNLVFDQAGNLETEPEGTWVATSSAFTIGTAASPGFFAATSPAMPVRNGNLITTPTQRVLSLTARVDPIFRLLAPPNPDLRATEPSEPLAIVGNYVETITHPTDPTITYLNTVTEGSFTITRAPNALPVLPSGFNFDN